MWPSDATKWQITVRKCTVTKWIIFPAVGIGCWWATVYSATIKSRIPKWTTDQHLHFHWPFQFGLFSSCSFFLWIAAKHLISHHLWWTHFSVTFVLSISSLLQIFFTASHTQLPHCNNPFPSTQPFVQQADTCWLCCHTAHIRHCASTCVTTIGLIKKRHRSHKDPSIIIYYSVTPTMGTQ